MPMAGVFGVMSSGETSSGGVIALILWRVYFSPLGYWRTSTLKEKLKGKFIMLSNKAQQDMDEIKPGRYRHFKGNEYEVLYLATHSETMEPMVVYRALYGERGVWVRPASMWNETVERDGQTYQRFTYIGEN